MFWYELCRVSLSLFITLKTIKVFINNLFIKTVITLKITKMIKNSSLKHYYICKKSRLKAYRTPLFFSPLVKHIIFCILNWSFHDIIRLSKASCMCTLKKITAQEPKEKKLRFVPLIYYHNSYVRHKFQDWATYPSWRSAPSKLVSKWKTYI